MDYENNPYYLRPGESQNAYYQRVLGYQPGSNTNQPVGDIFNVIGDERSQSANLQEDIFNESQNQSTDPEYYRRKFIGMFQDRINALNQVYDQQLAKAQQEGKGRVGQGTAVLARRGLAGSPRGGAIQEGVLDVNRGIESSIQAQRNAEIGAIMGTVSQMAVEEARAKAQAKAEGAASYLEHLKTQEARKEGYVEQNVQAALAQGLDINNVADTIAEKLGVSKDQVLLKYKDAVVAAEAAEYEKEGEELDRDKTRNEIELANKKFEEDKRQFGLDYALRARAQALDEIEAGAKTDKDKVDPSVSIQQANDTITTIDNLLNSKALNSAVGPSEVARQSIFEGFTNKKGDYISSINQLTSQLTLDKLVQAKDAGATFGSLEAGERLLLAAAATKINDYAVYSKKDGERKGQDGAKIIGYKATEAQFKKELNEIKRLAKLDLERRTKNIIGDAERAELDAAFEGEDDTGSYFD